jgi:hypothetical protein
MICSASRYQTERSSRPIVFISWCRSASPFSTFLPRNGTSGSSSSAETRHTCVGPQGDACQPKICVIRGCTNPAGPLLGVTLGIRTSSKRSDGMAQVRWENVSASHGGCHEDHGPGLRQIAARLNDKHVQPYVKLAADQQVYFFTSPTEMEAFIALEDTTQTP